MKRSRVLVQVGLYQQASGGAGGIGCGPFCNMVSVRTIISGVLVAIMCFRSCWLVKTPLTLRVMMFNEERFGLSQFGWRSGLCSWRGVVMVVDDVVVLFEAAILENGGQGRRAFMLKVHVSCLMGVISRLGCGEGLRDCEYGGGRGRWCVIHADHRIVDIRIRFKRYVAVC